MINELNYFIASCDLNCSRKLTRQRLKRTIHVLRQSISDKELYMRYAEDAVGKLKCLFTTLLCHIVLLYNI